MFGGLRCCGGSAATAASIKVSLLDREIFEQYYPGQARMIRDF